MQDHVVLSRGGASRQHLGKLGDFSIGHGQDGDVSLGEGLGGGNQDGAEVRGQSRRRVAPGRDQQAMSAAGQAAPQRARGSAAADKSKRQGPG
jgi:hypothetical protein